MQHIVPVFIEDGRPKVRFLHNSHLPDLSAYICRRIESWYLVKQPDFGQHILPLRSVWSDGDHFNAKDGRSMECCSAE